MKTIADWAIFWNPYHAPEIRAHCAYGICGGKEIRTSLIAEVLGTRSFRTSNGSVYCLAGHPSTRPEVAQYPQDEKDPLGDVRRCIEARSREKLCASKPT